MPPFPQVAAKVWDDFLDLHVTRRSGLNGPERISFTDLQARQIITGCRLEPWAVRAIFRIDAEFMAFLAREAKKSGA